MKNFADLVTYIIIIIFYEVVLCTCSNVTCPSNNNIRLTGLDSRVIGRLEVCYNNTWAGVCNKQWTLRNSIVACKMLGYKGAVEVNLALPSNRLTSSGSFHVSSPKCNGEEKTLTECEGIPFRMQECSNSNEVIIYCITTPQQGDVRLVGPGDDNSGIVEIYSQYYGWSTICINKWSNEEASIVCRQLNYDKGEKEVSSYFSQLLPVRHYDYFECTGQEENLFNCSTYYDHLNGCRTLSRGAVRCTKKNYCDAKNQIIISGSSIVFGIIVLLIFTACIVAYTKCKNFKKPTSSPHPNQTLFDNQCFIYNSRDAPPTYSESCTDSYTPSNNNTEDTSVV